MKNLANSPLGSLIVTVLALFLSVYHFYLLSKGTGARKFSLVCGPSMVSYHVRKIQKQEEIA